MPAGLATSSPSPDMVLVCLMKPVGSLGTSVSILLAANSSRCFLVFLPTQKNFDGSGIGGKNLTLGIATESRFASASSASWLSAASVCGPVVSAALTLGAGIGRRSALAAAIT